MRSSTVHPSTGVAWAVDEDVEEGSMGHLTAVGTMSEDNALSGPSSSSAVSPRGPVQQGVPSKWVSFEQELHEFGNQVTKDKAVHST